MLDRSDVFPSHSPVYEPSWTTENGDCFDRAIHFKRAWKVFKSIQDEALQAQKSVKSKILYSEGKDGSLNIATARHEVKAVYLSYLSIVSAKMSVYSKSVIMRLRYSRDLRPCWRHSKKNVCLSKGASSCLVNSYIKYGELLKAKNAREILLDEY